MGLTQHIEFSTQKLYRQNNDILRRCKGQFYEILMKFLRAFRISLSVRNIWRENFFVLPQRTLSTQRICVNPKHQIRNHKQIPKQKTKFQAYKVERPVNMSHCWAIQQWAQRCGWTISSDQFWGGTSSIRSSIDFCRGTKTALKSSAIRRTVSI